MPRSLSSTCSAKVSRAIAVTQDAQTMADLGGRSSASPPRMKHKAVFVFMSTCPGSGFFKNSTPSPQPVSATPPITIQMMAGTRDARRLIRADRSVGRANPGAGPGLAAMSRLSIQPRARKTLIGSSQAKSVADIQVFMAVPRP